MSSTAKVHCNTHNSITFKVIMKMTNKSVKYEVFVKQYLHAILDISEFLMMSIIFPDQSVNLISL